MQFYMVWTRDCFLDLNWNIQSLSKSIGWNTFTEPPFPPPHCLNMPGVIQSVCKLLSGLLSEQKWLSRPTVINQYTSSCRYFSSLSASFFPLSALLFISYIHCFKCHSQIIHTDIFFSGRLKETQSSPTLFLKSIISICAPDATWLASKLFVMSQIMSVGPPVKVSMKSELLFSCCCHMIRAVYLTSHQHQA